jgi:hypothetical protein
MTGSFERLDGSEEAMDHYFDVIEVELRLESRRSEPTLLLVEPSLGTTLGRILMQRRTPAHGFRRTRCRIEWTTEGSTHFYFSVFVSALWLCTFNFMFEQFNLL